MYRIIKKMYSENNSNNIKTFFHNLNLTRHIISEFEHFSVIRFDASIPASFSNS